MSSLSGDRGLSAIGQRDNSWAINNENNKIIANDNTFKDLRDHHQNIRKTSKSKAEDKIIN